MRFCDNTSICDTTRYIITILPIPEDILVNTRDDSAYITINTPVEIHPLRNDYIPRNEITEFKYILIDTGQYAAHGNVYINWADTSVLYDPETDFCGADAIRYVVCNKSGCDTAVIRIFIDCPSDEILIYNAFSPNNDGINDYFKIEGIERQTGNVLCVFNRWGNVVYRQENYKNDWTGTWKDQPLPDGTYYYVLEYGQKEMQSGYVVIYR